MLLERIKAQIHVHVPADLPTHQGTAVHYMTSRRHCTICCCMLDSSQVTHHEALLNHGKISPGTKVKGEECVRLCLPLPELPDLGKLCSALMAASSIPPVQSTMLY